MTQDFNVKITRAGVAGWEVTDDKANIHVSAFSWREALLEWSALAAQADLFNDDATPLLLPLKLVWPVQYEHVITQRFGARPEVYSKFGLPGHEGVDIRAPNNTPVLAVAPGIVYKVDQRYRPNKQAGKTEEHPYGYHIRIKHRLAEGEYMSIYAHLRHGSADPFIREGDVVSTGQQIALSNNTGNSSAPHLHFTLRKIGAHNGAWGEVIDPTPYLESFVYA
jgi:murein DD-endopeptidase MepM/ murein hydrolase activator NlpD